MHRRRATLTTLCLLVGILAIPVVLTYRAVRQEMLNQQLGRAFLQRDRREALALLDQGADANTLVPDEDTPPVSLGMLLRQRLAGRKPPPVTGTPCLLWALDLEEATGPLPPSNLPHRLHADRVAPPEDSELIAALLHHGARINVRGTYGMTPLLLALEWRHEHVATLLLHDHADVNQAEENGYTPLMAAVEIAAGGGDTQPILSVVNLLLASGARINATDARKLTPLIHAVAPGAANIPVVAFLLAHGANVDAQDDLGHTSISYAVYNRDMPAICCLLAHHANVNLRDIDDHSVLHNAEDADSGDRDEAIITLLKRAGAKE